MNHVDNANNSTPIHSLEAELPRGLADDGQSLANVTALLTQNGEMLSGSPLLILMLACLIWRELSTRRHAQAAAASIANLRSELSTVVGRLAVLEGPAKRRTPAKRRSRARSQA